MRKQKKRVPPNQKIALSIAIINLIIALISLALKLMEILEGT